ncbi:MAG: SAM-dependent methyltransferase [Pseudonocardiaceae bacterium]|nr:SAM-dependent methyltransferase [Pseudonocardiaceae bacterium]
MYAAALRGVAQLGVADQLAAGPRTPAELAAATGTQTAFLHRTLKLLATRGVFREDEDGRFHLTPEADALRSDAPSSLRPAVIMLTENNFWQSATEFPATMREGKPAFEQLFGKSFFDYMVNSEDAAVFHQGMASYASAGNPFIAQSYEFPAGSTVVDVGGGHGGFLLTVLRENPGVRGVLFDSDYVVAGHCLDELGADDRWELAPGDFFAEVPSGGDFYVLKYILHDWSDEECVSILRNCRRAMTPGSRVLVVDSVIPPGNEPHTGKLLDMFMMLVVTGRERSEEEFASLFAKADLRLSRVIPTGSPVSIVEGVAG